MADPTWDPNGVPVTFIERPDQLDELSRALESSVRVAVDTETHAATTFRDGMWSALRVISIATKDADGIYAAFVIDVRNIPASALAPIMASIKVADAWNANFDDRVLQLFGAPVPKWRDAMFTDGLLHSGASGFEFWHGLAHAAKKFLGLELSGKGTTQTSYDGDSDLTSDQIAYPAYDALVTLRLAETLDAKVDELGLTVPVDLEQAARPFILSMMEHGIPFDAQAWRSEMIAAHLVGRTEALAELAALTGGSEETLFGTLAEPSWKPDSDADVRNALNVYAKDAVMAFTGGRLLSKVDKLDKTTLKQINHPLAKTMLKYREHAKILSTYGDNLDKYVGDDGRIRPRYKQGGVVATGRLASDSPNAQNFSPQMKPYFRPAPHVQADGTVVPRAIVYADLSQAELRVLAQVSNEERMRELFRLGGDFHARTAADMFAVDMDSLKDSDPTAYSNNRKKAKGVNFGIPYGLGAGALATNLTVNSKLQTSFQEAADMLKRYAQAYPAVDSWLGVRDKFVKDTAANPGAMDWERSFRLHEIWQAADQLRKNFRRRNGRPASMEELAAEIESDGALRERLSAELGRDITEDDVADARSRQAAELTWAFTFDAPVVLRPDGSPWYFESRSQTGRRRLFTVPMDSSPKDKFEGVLTSVALIVCTSNKEGAAAVRAKFAEIHGLDLPVGINRCQRNAGESEREFRARSNEFRKRERVAVIKAFEGGNKSLKYELYKFVRAEMGDVAVEKYLLPDAVSDQIRSMGNRFRNHPIQSLVADVGLQYYADLHERLANYRDAYPIQAVHDSIAIECDLSEAFELCAEVKDALQAALATWSPDVPAVADADVRISLADEDVITPERAAELLAEVNDEPVLV